MTTKKQKKNSTIDNKMRGIKIIMGDINAKVGSDNTGREEIMGKHGLGTMNEMENCLQTFVHLTT